MRPVPVDINRLEDRQDPSTQADIEFRHDLVAWMRYIRPGHPARSSPDPDTHILRRRSMCLLTSPRQSSDPYLLPLPQKKATLRTTTSAH